MTNKISMTALGALFALGLAAPASAQIYANASADVDASANVSANASARDGSDADADVRGDADTNANASVEGSEFSQLTEGNADSGGLADEDTTETAEMPALTLPSTPDAEATAAGGLEVAGSTVFGLINNSQERAAITSERASASAGNTVVNGKSRVFGAAVDGKEKGSDTLDSAVMTGEGSVASLANTLNGADVSADVNGEVTTSVLSTINDTASTDVAIEIANEISGEISSEIEHTVKAGVVNDLAGSLGL